MSDNSLHFKNSLIALIVIAAIIYGVNTFFTNLVTIKTVDTSTLEDRIKPIGQVYLEGDIDGTAVVAEKSVAVAKKSRSKSYCRNPFTNPMIPQVQSIEFREDPLVI